MRRPRRFHVEALEGRVVLSTALSPSGNAPVLRAAIVANQAPPPPSTTDQMLRDVMGDEALAYATYRAYAAAAQRRGDKELASVWNTTADVELQEHFTEEAKLAGLVKDNVSNLNAAIDAETGAINNYTIYANQASDVSQRVSKTFREIAADEKIHLDLFKQALSALQGKGNVPSGPTVQPTKIVSSKAATNDTTTLGNIAAAQRDEAFAYAEYTLFARQAVNTGEPRLAALFTAIAKVELKDHFAKEANLAGLVGSNTDNLKASITDETGAAAKYQSYASNVKDNPAVATLFLDSAQDELGHAKSFQVLLNSQTGRTH